MATNNVAPIAMPGGMTNRTDKGLVQRVQKVQRDAKLNRAAGGTYNERNTVNSLMVGNKMATTGSAVSQDVVTPGVNLGGTPAGAVAPSITPIGAFERGSAADVPYSEGSPWGPGATTSNIPAVQAPDTGSALARALLLQNPTNPQLVAIVQAYNEAGL